MLAPLPSLSGSAGKHFAAQARAYWFVMEHLEPRRVFNAPGAGAIDLSYGDQGVATVNLPPPAAADAGDDSASMPTMASPWTSAVGADGKVVVAGSVTDPADGFHSLVGLARFNADGTPDASFGTGGLVQTDFGPGYGEANRLLIQPDGKILIVGDALAPGGSGDALPPSSDSVAPRFGYGTDQAFILARYNPDGSLDTTFGQGGKVVTDFGPTDDEAYGVALQADGKIVASGQSGTALALVRFNADGSLDPTFGGGGKVVTPGPATGDTNDDGSPVTNTIDGDGGVKVLPDGRLLVVGDEFGLDGSFSQIFSYYSPAGSLDASYTHLESSSSSSGDINACVDNFAALPDGKIVVFNYSGTNAVERFNADGTPDVTFTASADPFFVDASGGAGTVYEGAVQSDGKIVVATSGGVGRLNADGTPDATFGTDGLTSPGIRSQTLALAPDGTVYAAGVDNLARFTAVRLLPNQGVAPATAALDPVATYTDTASGPLLINVTYRGGGGISADTISGNNLTATRADGLQAYFDVDHTTTNADGSITATYVVSSGRDDSDANGDLAFGDNGTYTVDNLNGTSVSARDGGTVAPGILGQFTIQLPPSATDGTGDNTGDGTGDNSAGGSGASDGPVSILDLTASSGGPAFDASSADGSAADGLLSADGSLPADPTDAAALTNRGLAGAAPAAPQASTTADASFLRSATASPADSLTSNGGADGAAVWD